jgi:predicted dehydrogenase
MTKKVRFAILGCGTISKKHLHAISQLPEDVEAVAVCDVNAEAARAVGEQWGLPYYTDPHQMLSEHEVDVITVLTPSGQHANSVLDLVGYGKTFLVEKPLALRLEDADRVTLACNRHGSNIFVVQQNRCNLPVVKLHEALTMGRFGKLVMGTVRVRWCRREQYYASRPWRGTWSQDGGVFTNQASHHIDLLTWLMGDVESVKAMTATRLANIEAEDTGAAVLRFTNGALGVVEATTATRPKDLEGSLSILGEKGAVVIGGFAANRLETWQFEEPLPEDEHIFQTCGQNPNEFAWNHIEYIKRIITAIRGNVCGLVDGLEGRKSLELINAIYESVESGQEVFLTFKPRMCKLGI